MNRLRLAWRCVVEVLSQGRLSDETALALGLGAAPGPVPPPGLVPAAPASRDGALQLLAILQRDARLVDFLMEDISAYTNEEIGTAVREVHDQARQSLARYVRLVPVIEGPENARTALPPGQIDPSGVKLVGNVPATGRPSAGILRHRGWRADVVDLPPVPRDGITVIAPAEIEVE